MILEIEFIKASRRVKQITFLLLIILASIQFSGCDYFNERGSNDDRAGLDTQTAASEEIYIDPSAPIDDRVEDLLRRMTLEEKIGQMTQVENQSISERDITSLYIGSILSGGGGQPRPNTPKAWVDMVNNYQEYALETRLGIPLIYGVDAVHGHNGVKGAVIFPHNIGLGATRDAELVRRVAGVTAEEMTATGIWWNFAPVLAVPQDIRWGRTYESFSEDTELNSMLGRAFIEGLQGDDLSDPLTALATPKHFIGDGGTAWGSSTTEIFVPYMLDQGDTQLDEETLRVVHLPPYIEAIEAGAQSIMVSFSSWNGVKLHGHKYLLSDVLKGELGFNGFLVSDWGGIDQISPDYYEAVVTAINAGIDMVMVPYNYELFIDTLKEAVENGDVSMERIDDAVRRVIRVKILLGLFENHFAQETLLGNVGSEGHRDLAREAVIKSLVLLKNENECLPILEEDIILFVAGQAADDLGLQLGGWSLGWQGSSGDVTDGTTILEGIETAAPGGTEVHYDPLGKFDRERNADGVALIADYAIVVVGEQPYAEGVGDREDLHLSDEDMALIGRVRERSKHLIVVLISGRPMIINDQLALSDVFIAAWLPGTEGQGVAEAIFGDALFTGKLPFTWPRSMDQIPMEELRASDIEPLFPFGFGLTSTIHE